MDCEFRIYGDKCRKLGSGKADSKGYESSYERCPHMDNPQNCRVC